jgi:small GTP-binding protein
MINRHFDFSLKVVAIGDSGVGKTSLLRRYADGSCPEDHVPTVVVDLITRVVETDKHRFQLQIWDTAGQEAFHSVVMKYYRGAAGALVLYDILKEESFLNVERWIAEVKHAAREDVVIFLVGNKTDLESERVVTKAQAEELAQKYHLKYFETSAKTGDQIKEMMASFISDINALATSGAYPIETILELNPPDEPPPKQAGCCG